MGIIRFDYPVMHPLAISPGGNHARAPKIGKMTRNFWLTYA
jgi:hypothetical protein